MPGPQPKPTYLKILEGNPGKRKLNRREPRFSSDGLTCPKWLKGDARREWQRLVPMLKRQGVATTVDRAVLAGYCQSYARWKQAEEIIDRCGMVMEFQREDGSTYMQQRPEVSIAQKSFQLMLQASARLGLDPASRSKVSVPEQERDELDDLLGGQRKAGAG